MDFGEDVQMTGVGLDPIVDQSSPVPAKTSIVHNKVTEYTLDMSEPGGENGNENGDILLDTPTTPEPTQVSILSLPVQPISYTDTTSGESSNSDSQVSLLQNGSQYVRKLDRVEIVSKPVADTLPYASKQTGLVYDPRMRFHTELEIDEEDDIHPEDPRRIYQIFQDLLEAGLVQTDDEPIDERLRPWKLLRIPTREVEPEEVRLVHSERLYQWMTQLRTKPIDELISIGRQADSLYLHPLTFTCAKLSAGGVIEACRAVASGRVRNAVAVVRPPGHHAEHDKPGGFCFFDNVAIAARVCQKDFGDQCRKVLILDWDVHHGNGVQMAFEDDPNVLYISLHVHMGGKFYPSGNYGDHLHVGKGDGVGRNINIPWTTNGMGDSDYIYAFQNVVMPCAYEFNPDLVIIAAGFDAADGDLLGGCHVTPAGFAHMTHMLMSLAGGKVVACLEGGYNLSAIARSFLAMTRTLMGEQPDRLLDGITASPIAVDVVDLVKKTHAPYWKCLYPKSKAIDRVESLGGERLHDMLRLMQANEYWLNYKMSSLWIMRDKVSKSFNQQVMATDDYTLAKPLLLIFHDPPETIGEPNTHTGTFDAHNIIVTDYSKQYVDFAVTNQLAVIDVNMPKFVTNPTANDSAEDADPLEMRLKALRDCAQYLWDNYVTPYDTTQIILMGIGDAAAAVTHLLSHADSIQERVSWIFNFTSEHDLRSVQRPGDDYFIDWYFKHSECFVAHNHQAWSPDRNRRVRRKYGNLVRCESDDLNEIMFEKKGIVERKLLDLTDRWREEERRKTALPQKMHGVSSAALASPSQSQFGDEVKSSLLNASQTSALSGSYTQASPSGGSLGLGVAYTHNSGSEMPVRNSPTTSPRIQDGPKSPVSKLPPLGLFSASPDRGNSGIRSPLLGSPSRRVQ